MSRTKKVGDSKFVAHAWAAAINSSDNTQDARTSSRNFWFNNRVLYSYSTPVAKIERAADNEPVALLSSEHYSPTTGRQLGEARDATRHLKRFNVPAIGELSSEGRYIAPYNEYSLTKRAQRMKEVHKVNVAYYLDKYTKTVGTLTRARSLYHGDMMSVRGYLESASDELREYCAAFKLVSPGLPIDDDAAAIWAAKERRDAREADPLIGEKRRKAREQREAAAARKAERERAELAVKQREALTLWRAGGWAPYNLGRLDSEHGGAALRIDARTATEGGDVWRTSWGADVPYRVGCDMLMAYFSGDIVSGMECGPFRVVSSDDDKLVIGCHHFMRAELLYAFKSLMGGK